MDPVKLPIQPPMQLTNLPQKAVRSLNEKPGFLPQVGARVICLTMVPTAVIDSLAGETQGLLKIVAGLILRFTEAVANRTVCRSLDFTTSSWLKNVTVTQGCHEIVQSSLRWAGIKAAVSGALVDPAIALRENERLGLAQKPVQPGILERMKGKLTGMPLYQAMVKKGADAAKYVANGAVKVGTPVVNGVKYVGTPVVNGVKYVGTPVVNGAKVVGTPVVNGAKVVGQTAYAHKGKVAAAAAVVGTGALYYNDMLNVESAQAGLDGVKQFGSDQYEWFVNGKDMPAARAADKLAADKLAASWGAWARSLILN